jgi:hypothetical protein
MQTVYQKIIFIQVIDKMRFFNLTGLPGVYLFLLFDEARMRKLAISGHKAYVNRC